MKTSMRYLFISTAILLCTSAGISQDTVVPLGALPKGIKIEGNHILISDQCRRLLSDAEYRNETFPDKYEFGAITRLIKDQNLSLVLWYLINLYQEAPVFTMGLVKDLSALDISPEDYVTSFYTYAYADPNIVEIKKGRYQLLHPERLEEKIKVTNTLAYLAKKLKG